MRHNNVLFLIAFLSYIVSCQTLYSQVQIRCKDCNKIFDLPKDILKDKKLGVALDAISKNSAGAELSYEIREILSAFGANENFNRIKLQNNSICKAIHCLQEDPDEARARINLLFDKVFGTYDEEYLPAEFNETDRAPSDDFSATEEAKSGATEPSIEDSLSGKNDKEILRVGQQVKVGNCTCFVLETDEKGGKATLELKSHEGIESSVTRVVASGESIIFKGCKVELDRIMDVNSVSISLSEVN